LADGPKTQSPGQSGKGFWIAVSCLAVGYFVGQNSAAQKQPLNSAAVPTEASTASIEQLAALDAKQGRETPLAPNFNATANEGAATDVDSVQANTDGSDAADYHSIDTGEAPPVETADASSNSDFARRTGLADPPPMRAADATGGAGPTAPWTAYQTASETPPASTSYSTSGLPYSYSGASTAYAPPPVSKCESLGCYGQISTVTGLPRTTYVHGYVRSNGTYVRPYYRSHR
jgi:hypothetical protein